MREAINDEELELVNGGAKYTVQWNEKLQKYQFYNKKGNEVFKSEKIVTSHGLDAFRDRHPKDTFIIK